MAALVREGRPAPMNIIDIADPADQRLDPFRNLNVADRRPDRGGNGLVIAEGLYVVGRMLLSRLDTLALVGTEAKLERLRADAAAEGWDLDTAAGNAPFYRVSNPVLSQVIGFPSSRDIIAVAPRPAPLRVEQVVDGARTLIVAEGVNDPENLGAVFRGAAAFGADAVLLGAATADPWYRRTVRVSMGHVLAVPWAAMGGTPTTWQRGLAPLHEQGFTTIALTPAASHTVAEAVALAHAQDESRPGASDGKIALLIGAEGPGLTEHAMRAAHIRARIPMADGVDSLNVATAATIALYETVRA